MDLTIFRPKRRLSSPVMDWNDLFAPLSKEEQRDKVVEALRLCAWGTDSDHMGMEWQGAGHVDFFVNEKTNVIDADVRFGPDRDKRVKFARLFADVGLAVVEDCDPPELLAQPED